MFNFGLSYKDWTRIAWTFAQAAVGYGLLAYANVVPGAPVSWRAIIVGAAAAGLSAAKNFALADDSPIK